MDVDPDTSRFVVRVDAFDRVGQPGIAPDSVDIENFLLAQLTRAYPSQQYIVEVEERLA